MKTISTTLHTNFLSTRLAKIQSIYLKLETSTKSYNNKDYTLKHCLSFEGYPAIFDRGNVRTISLELC